MRSFALIGLMAVACSTPPVDGDSLGDDPTDPPERGSAQTTNSDPNETDNKVPAVGSSKMKLTVTLTGSGKITSSPTGISCAGTTCTGDFAQGTAVTLTQAADNGILFGGWGGGCTGTATCAVTMDAAKNLTAAFVSVEGTWTGTYTNTRTANGCTFNNGGNAEMTNAPNGGNLSSSVKVGGLEIRELGSCNLQGSVNGQSNPEALTFSQSTNDFTGLWTVNVQVGGQLPFPFKAKMDGDKLVGTWTCTGCTGGFTLTKKP